MIYCPNSWTEMANCSLALTDMDPHPLYSIRAFCFYQVQLSSAQNKTHKVNQSGRAIPRLSYAAILSGCGNRIRSLVVRRKVSRETCHKPPLDTRDVAVAVAIIAKRTQTFKAMVSCN